MTMSELQPPPYALWWLTAVSRRQERMRWQRRVPKRYSGCQMFCCSSANSVLPLGFMRCWRSVVRPHDSVRFRTNTQALLRKVRPSGRVHHHFQSPTLLGWAFSHLCFPHTVRGFCRFCVCHRPYRAGQKAPTDPPSLTLFWSLFSKNRQELRQPSTRTNPLVTSSCH